MLTLYTEKVLNYEPHSGISCKYYAPRERTTLEKCVINTVHIPLTLLVWSTVIGYHLLTSTLP